jgi:site-specific recombinase XerD
MPALPSVVTNQQVILVSATYAADQNPALVYLASLSESSRRPQRQSLQAIAAIILPDTSFDAVPWGNLRYQHTTAIRTKLAETYSAATANRHLSALRGVLKEAWRLGYMNAEDYQRAIDLKAIKGQKAAQAEKGRHLKSGELTALVNVCQDGTKAGLRDAALVAVGYAAGLRRAELAALALEDYDCENSTLMIRRGKGNKERSVPLADSAADALNDWVAMRGVWAGPLFTRIRRGDTLLQEGLTAQAVYYILSERAVEAGVKKFAPHDLRRTFAGDLLDAGVDLSTVQKLMGHASASTTSGYDRRDAKAKRSAVNKLHIAYQKQGPTANRQNK